MNIATYPTDPLEMAERIERLIPGDPLAAELRRLHIVEQAFQQWINRTEWVQKSAQSHELGMHRADVMKQRLDQLLDENKKLRTDLEAIGAGGVGPLMPTTVHPHCEPLTEEQIAYAKRYAWLRSRDVDAISSGGVFAGMTPENVVLNGEDLDAAIDAAIERAHGIGVEA